VLLAAASRADYLALGGDATHHTLDQPRGRAHVDGMAVQIAVSARHHEQTVATTREWVPGDGVTGFAARRSTTTRAVVRRWEDGGARALSVEQAAERVHEGTGLETPGVRTLVVGDAEDWQRQWQLLRAVRDEHSLVIHPSVSADFRTLSADRTLPPYCAPGRPSAWLCRDGAPAIRILLPATMRVLEDAPAKSESP
jgi:S-DNA-T family DNA segregation ATPase FtsK/SpoIIIE